MASTDKELEEQLLEAGNKLADPPSSVEEILSLLDQVESFLSRVEQSPSNSMQIALSPSLKALISDKLLRHSDDDVKVAVASCISEITRITAPEAPYDDDQMKEVFQLIVSSFENLHDKLSRSYVKRISILETVAKVRSCVVMLDLECDALISDMFQHFLKGVREHHPENVFSSMETVMTLVVEESEDISLDLLSPILDSIKKDNEEVFPIAQKLGERVLESCATKLKPYLVQAVKSLGISVDDYSSVLALICQDTSDDLEKNDTCVTSEHVEDKSESAKQSLEESTHEVKKDSREVTSSQQENPDPNKSPNSVMSYGIACVGEDTALADSNPIKKQEDADCSNHSEGLNISGLEVRNDLDIEKVDNNKQKAGKASKRPRKKSSSSTKSAKPSKVQVAANEKETEKMLDHESNSKIVPSSPHEDPFVEVAGPSENKKEIDGKISSAKALNDESEGVVSPPSESLNDENHSKKLGRSKKKDDPVKEGATYDVSKVSGGGSDLEAKPARRSVKRALSQKSDLKETSVVDSVKKGSGTTNNADAKKYAAKKLDENKKGSGGSSSRQVEERKKGGRGKAKSETDVAKSSAMNVDKEMVSSPRSGTKSTKDESSEETPKANVKRKLSSGKENESGVKEYGENLVGLRVKVWWPKDREFYKGVIDSFDSAKKKHKVSYDDGDEEILNLGKEKWKVIEEDSDEDEEEQSDRASLDASTDMHPKKKGKTSAGESTKQGKMDVSSRSGGVTTSRSKGVSTKSSHKSKDGNKSKDSKTISKSEDEVNRKSKDEVNRKSKDSKTISKSEDEVNRKSKDSKAISKYEDEVYRRSKDEVNRKSKDDTPKSSSSKSLVASKKSSNKSKNTDVSQTRESKDDDTSTPKPSSKSKQEILKGGKSKKTTPKTDVNGTGKVKSGLLKRKDFENDNSDVSEGEVEDAKGKASTSSKAQGSEVKSGKKRRRS